VKLRIEVREGVEAALKGDLRDGKIRFLQQFVVW